MIGVPVLFVVLLSIPCAVAKNPSYIPPVWLFIQYIIPKLKPVYGSTTASEVVIPNRYEAAVVSTGAGVLNLAAVLTDCIPQLQQPGEAVDITQCVNSVLVAAIGAALAGGRIKKAGTWYRRDTSEVDDFMSVFPDYVKITNIKMSGQSISQNSSSLAVRRRGAYAQEAPINVNYNGSLPLSFIYHHPLASSTLNSTSNSTGYIPVFIATDGERFQVNHIKPVNQTSSSMNQTTAYSRCSSAIRRSGLTTQYNHVGAGGVKLQMKTTAVATWSDVEAWLDPSVHQGALYWFKELASKSMWVGHSLTNYILQHGTVDSDWVSGQFIMEGETDAFDDNWEKNWNWCFGPHKTNCEKGVANVG